MFLVANHQQVARGGCSGKYDTELLYAEVVGTAPTARAMFLHHYFLISG